MSMKSKSIKRLVALSCAAAIVLCGLAGAYVFRKYQVRQQLAHDRSEGLAAVQQKDYATGVKELSEYLAAGLTISRPLKAYAGRARLWARMICRKPKTLWHTCASSCCWTHRKATRGGN